MLLAAFSAQKEVGGLRGTTCCSASAPLSELVIFANDPIAARALDAVVPASTSDATERTQTAIRRQSERRKNALRTWTKRKTKCQGEMQSA